MFWIVLYIDISPSLSLNVSDAFSAIKFYIAIGFLFTMLHSTTYPSNYSNHMGPHMWANLQDKILKMNIQ
jgi:hypothetical protein